MAEASGSLIVPPATRAVLLRSRFGIAGIVTAGAAAFAATIALGYFTLFSTFAPYDDEGYFLVSLKGYLSGARLYNDVHAEYGPFLFEALAVSFKGLGLAVTNDGGRIVTLAYWLLASALLALATYGMTRRRLLALAVYLISFRVLSLAPNEPTAPGNLLVVLVTGMVASVALVLPRRPRLAFALLGALGAAAALTKINVGGFALLAIVYATVLVSPRLIRTRAVIAATVIAFALVPVALMTHGAGSSPVRTFMLHIAFSGLALGAIAWRLTRHTLERGGREESIYWLLWLAAGAVVLAVPVIGLVLAQGTSPVAVARSVVLNALRQPGIFSLPLHLPGGIVFLDIASLAAAAIAVRVRVRGEMPQRLQPLAAIGRIVVGLVIWQQLLGSHPLGLPATLVWVATVPAEGDAHSTRARFCRLFLPAFAILQALKAYPVAGSQVEWSAMLFVAAGAVCVSDGLRTIASLTGTRSPFAWAAPLALGLWLLLRTIALPIDDARANYSGGVSIAEPGATRIRLPPATAATYRWLVTMLDRDCTTFVSSPGFGSLYLLARETPPSWINGSAWPFALDAKSQEQVVQAARNTTGLCAIRSTAVEGFWARGRPIPRFPLHKFIVDGFRVVAGRGGFEFMVRRAR